ncbi:MAG TPA: hypothetical protein PLV42_01025 [bacterium]|nr:hypothetical protein [bacterium]
MRKSILLLLLASLFALSCGEEKKPTNDDDNIAGDTDTDAAPTDGDGDIDKALPEKDAAADTDASGDDETSDDDEMPIDGDTGPDIDQVWANADDDGDGIPNGKECATYPCEDDDDDGTPNNLDLDADNDGIPDSVEAPSGIPVDTDKDGSPDFKDTDSDGDTIPDSVEAGADPTEPLDSDGKAPADYRDTDSDDDGIMDDDECPAQPCRDNDGDTTPDFIDTDADDDGIPDLYENQLDPELNDFDKDGMPNHLDDDSDGDGILDAIENGTGTTPADTDEDGRYDFLDGDSDGDGLSDAKELEASSDPTKKDTDGDGTDDNTEVVLGYDPTKASSNIPAGYFYLYLPYNDPAKVRDLNFSTDIRTADILIMVDLSNSMSGEHANLKTSINDIIITQVSAAISDAQFGLVKFGPIDMEQTDATQKTANIYLPAQTMTANATAVQTAVNAIAPTSGTYEYITEALYQTITGDGSYQRICKDIVGGCNPGGYQIIVDIDPASCAAGHFGGACFRPNALPIIIMMTDEEFMKDETDDGKPNVDLASTYGSAIWLSQTGTGDPIVDNAPRSVAQVIAAMNAINAKFIGLDSSAGQVAMADFDAIAQGTTSVDGAGADFNQTIDPTGTGMSNDLVDAIIQLTQHIEIDVSTLTKHMDNTFGVADTTQFITGITPDSFPDVEPGQTVTFTVTFQNTIYDNTSFEAHLFIAKIEVWGAGTVLDTRDCYIIVPGKDPSDPS